MIHVPHADLDPILDGREIETLLRKSRQTIWRWERAGMFPKRVKLGPNSVGWRKSEVSAWLDARERHESTEAA